MTISGVKRSLPFFACPGYPRPSFSHNAQISLKPHELSVYPYSPDVSPGSQGNLRMKLKKSQQEKPSYYAAAQNAGPHSFF
jgi:hypothetical protein